MGTFRINKPALPLKWTQVYTSQHYLLAQGHASKQLPQWFVPATRHWIPNAPLDINTYGHICHHINPPMMETQGSIKMINMNSHSHSCSFQKALWSTTNQEASNHIYSTVPVIWCVVTWYIFLGEMPSDCCTILIKHYIWLTIRSVCNGVNYATHHHNHVCTPSLSIIIYFHGLLLTVYVCTVCQSFCCVTGFAFMSAIVLQFLDGNVLRKW